MYNTQFGLHAKNSYKNLSKNVSKTNQIGLNIRALVLDITIMLHAAEMNIGNHLVQIA